MKEHGRRYNSCGYMFTDEKGKAHYYDDQTDNYQQTNYQLLIDHTFSPAWHLNAGLHYTKGDGYYQEYKSNRKLVEYAETAPINRIETGKSNAMGIITSSTSYQYVKEVLGDTYPVMKLGLIWPMPEQKIRDFAASVEKLVIVEELEGFIESHCRDLGLACIGKERT
jgi:hypothetical protein